MFKFNPEDVKNVMAGSMISDALRNYKYVTGALFHQEISADYTFQKAYCELYNLGDDYPEEFKTKFFRLLENMKKKSDISFRDAFEELLSFDKAAVDFFDMEIPKDGDSVERCCKLYEDFSDNFYAYANSAEGAQLVKVFDERFPSADIPDVIKVAFLLWQLECLAN